MLEKADADLLIWGKVEQHSSKIILVSRYSLQKNGAPSASDELKNYPVYTLDLPDTTGSVITGIALTLTAHKFALQKFDRESAPTEWTIHQMV